MTAAGDHSARPGGPDRPRPAILVCRCVHTTLAPARVRDFAPPPGALSPPIVVDDLCALAAAHEPLLGELAAAPALVVVACRPRAILNLFRAAGTPLDPSRVRFVDARAAAAAELDAWLPPAGDRGATAPDATPAEAPGAWFPVIDRDRCTACGQCLSFCLFGVYASDNGKTPRVETPLNCKPNCPACARICPAAAIVFPKCPEAPIDGSAITDEAAEHERIQADVAQWLGEDPYAALAARREKRRKLIDQQRLARALAERDAARAAAPETAGTGSP